MGTSWTKWGKYKLMRRDEALAPYLPETHRCKETNFQQLLEKYGSVIVKPQGSYGGAGVMHIKLLKDGRCRIHAGTARTYTDNREQAWEQLKPRIGSRYIVQQRIDLARSRGRPFDFRVMVQRKRGSRKWLATGELAKVAGAGHIITNVRRSGGYVATAQRALAGSDCIRRPAAVIDEIRTAARLSARCLGNRFSRQREMGIDIGVDRSGRVWIIEANFKPDPTLFLKLKDKSMYRTIQAYRG